MLLDGANQLGIELTQEQVEQFERYMVLLLEYNQKFNLTAITEQNEIVTKHFLDSLTCISHIPQGSKIADVGSGAGFPGLAIKIARPDVKLTLLDSLNKRIGFLRTVADELGLANVECIHIRAEDAGKTPTLREGFDIVTARAVAAMNVLSEYCMPLVRVGGHMLAMKGRDSKEELEEAMPLMKQLGSGKIEVYQYTLPDTDITHSIIQIEKREKTPKNYPRKGNKVGH